MEHNRRAAVINSYGFEDRVRESLNAVIAVRELNEFTEEIDAQINNTLSMIDAEAAGGTTAPTSLKVHRAKALAVSAS